jgi:hypothetical protein
MKSFTFCKLPLVFVVLGGALILSPGARAQSEVAPDHFDGTDSWATAAPVARSVAKPKAHTAMAKQQAQSAHSTAPALQPVNAHELTTSKRRKSAARKSTGQSN